MTQPKKAAERSTSTRANWRDLSWDELEAWAGASSLRKGRQYQRSGRVRNLARGNSGALVAWVNGSTRYVTQVELRDQPTDGTRLVARCTCPLQISGCKHAVAVVVQYLEALKTGATVPAIASDDERLQLLDAPRKAPTPSPYGFDEDEYDEEADEEPAPRPAARAGRGSDLRSFLKGWSEDELVSYIVDLAKEYPEVRRRLTTRATVERGDAAKLIAEAKQEIGRVTSERSWYDHWRHENQLPSYAGLRQRLERLLEMGQADALLSLGETLFKAGARQVESSDDEGHAAGELGSCMKVVFQAVPLSSRGDAQKLLFVIDRMLEDPIDMCSGADAVLEAEWPARAWSEVADGLLRRLHGLPATKGADDFSRNYKRDELSNWAICSLRYAGREVEVLPLCEAEAPLTNSYERLVKELIAARRFEDAKREARAGIDRTAQRWPGIASNMRQSLVEIVTAEKDWPALIALRTEEFVGRPGVRSLEELLKAAKKTGSVETVRAAALHFLETGAFPAAASSVPARPAGRGKKPTPLPAERTAGKPHLDVLLQLALDEKRPDDVLHWYDRLSTGSGNRVSYLAAQVADAVAATHPDRALAIYQSIIEGNVKQTSPSAYESALPYLRKVRDLLRKGKRAAEWTTYLADLREKHRRKSRFMEVLDRVEGRRIVDG